MAPSEPLLILLALIMDLTLGDPRSLPHPVVFIGRLVTVLERLLRRICPGERIAGVLLLAGVVSISALAVWLVIRTAARLHPLAGFILSVVISWYCLAARSLHHESSLVARALAANDLATARTALSRIVGRDTGELDEPEIWRALIETVAENTTDGIIAPLFWLTLGGPVAGIAYKAVSTLDSMVGYKNERYLRFGWASARTDDILNFIPARLTLIIMVIAAPLCRLPARRALTIALRDRLKHPSPNSGHAEAAAAGALGVRLGGRAVYSGRVSWKEYIGDPDLPVTGSSYDSMIRLMYASTLLMAAACAAGAGLIRGFHVHL